MNNGEEIRKGRKKGKKKKKMELAELTLFPRFIRYLVKIFMKRRWRSVRSPESETESEKSGVLRDYASFILYEFRFSLGGHFFFIMTVN